MKIRMTVSVSGTRNGTDWPPRGSVIDLPDAEALDYVQSGMAEPIADFAGPVEKAVVEETGVEVRTEPSSADVRAWAADNGIEVPLRGKIPADVLEKYNAR